MTNVAIPTRSDAAMAARDVFFEQFNDVNFYVEDEDQENLYFELLHRQFPTLRISKIFPLRGKKNVIAHAQDPVNKNRAAKSVYILDKDFDDLLARVVAQNNIFYLEKYSIENYLLEEEAVVEVGVESRPVIQRDTMKAMLAYPRFHAGLVRGLKYLAKLFFVVQKYDLGLKNCDLAPQQFSVTGSHETLNTTAIDEYADKVLSSAKAAGIFAEEGELRAFLATAFPKTKYGDANVPGYFLLAFTFHHLKKHVAMGSVTIDSVRYRLAKNCSNMPLQGIAKRIRKYLAASGIQA